MNNVSQLFVGLDYHQHSIQVCAIDAAAKVRLNRSVDNDPLAVRDALAAVGGNVAKVAVEACSGSADLAQRMVDDFGWHVELAHPSYVAKLKGSPDKTDYSDARLLADLTRVGYLPRVWLAPAPLRDLRLLVNRRQQLVDARRNAKLRVGGVLREQRVKIEGASRWTKVWVAKARDNGRLSEEARWIVDQQLDEVDHLTRQVVACDARLRKVTKNDPVVKRLMEEIEGVGEVTAWVMRAFIGEFKRFKTGKQLGRYCGLSPKNASSGQRQADAGLVKAGNRLLRATVIQAAQRLMRTSERWSKLADSMLRRGKPKNVVVAAIGNRWLRSVHHRMKEARGADNAATAGTGEVVKTDVKTSVKTRAKTKTKTKAL